MSAADRLAEASSVGRVALTVGSLQEALSFYRDVIGLTLHERVGGRATLGADRPFLVLLEDPEAVDRGRDQAGLYHLAIRVPDRPALGAALERIEAEYHLDGASDHGVSEALYLHDPAGNGLEIYCDRPREEWPSGDGGRVAMVTDPLDVEGVRAASDGNAMVPPDTDVGHVHLEVPDLARARSFYVDALGMNVRAEYGSGALFVAAGDYHHHVGLNTWHGRRQPAGEGTLGLAWYELVVPEASDLRELVDRLLEHGVDVLGDAGELKVVDPAGVPIRLRPADGVVESEDPSAERSG